MSILSTARTTSLLLLVGAAFVSSAGAQSLTPPAGNTLLLSTFGNGIQIYHSSQSASGAFQWTFFAPSATLYTDSTEAQPVATHYTGPTWQFNADGSSVVGSTFASAPSANTGSIPQLLLAAKSHGGTGEFSTVSFIQRLDTFGGIAPAFAPTALGQEADVPYHAAYNFYAPAAVPEASTTVSFGLLLLGAGAAVVAAKRLRA